MTIECSLNMMVSFHVCMCLFTAMLASIQGMLCSIFHNRTMHICIYKQCKLIMVHKHVIYTCSYHDIRTRFRMHFVKQNYYDEIWRILDLYC